VRCKSENRSCGGVNFEGEKTIVLRCRKNLLSRSKTRGDATGPPGVLRDNRLQTKTERNHSLAARKSKEEQAALEVTTLHGKHRPKTSGGVCSSRERERVCARTKSSRGKLSELITKTEMAQRFKTRLHAARGKASEESAARRKKISTVENTRRGVTPTVVPWHGSRTRDRGRAGTKKIKRRNR
jgi:hypothetical protein